MVHGRLAQVGFHKDDPSVQLLRDRQRKVRRSDRFAFALLRAGHENASERARAFGMRQTRSQRPVLLRCERLG